MHRRLIMAAFAAVALALSAAVPVASAVEPTHFTIDELVEDYIFYPGDVCEFQVVSGWRSVGHGTRFYDQAGTLIKDSATGFTQQWWSANGKTVITNWQHAVLTIYDPEANDGVGRYFTWEMAPTRVYWPDGSLVGRGPGGRITFDFSTDPWTFTFTPGTGKWWGSTFCEALAP